ncbi:toll/interleukin-1 receptor domain-containing protein, partial [Streptomyces sp. NPDC056983]|uniref:toll/interleukin-1 receptor domain-containing protein n=1 Tax=Streptomyces sp. NPDC056983 TaxID=3345987 RepID=UPI00362B7B9A
MERDCFISYSHKADIPLAEAIEKGLGDIGRPWTRRPALNVFRDTRSLAASADLPGSILKELRRSRYFIYIASPEASASRWVREELRFWRDHPEASARSRFLIALSDGDIYWNESTKDFDWDRTTSIPNDLRGIFNTEPLWVDLRSFRDCSVRPLTPGSPFRDKVVTLGAAVRDCTKDELDSDDLRQQRRVKHVRNTAIALLTTFALIASISAVVAFLQRNEARTRARTSASQALAARAMQVASTDPRQAAQFALYAEQVKPTSESLSALAQVVGANAHVARHFQGGSGAVANYSGSGGGTPTQVAVSRNGNMFAYYTGFDVGDPSGRHPKIHLYDIRTQKSLPTLQGKFFPLGGGAFELSAGGRILIIERAYNEIEVRNTRDGRVVQSITASNGRDLCNACQGLKAFALSPDGNRIAAAFNEPVGHAGGMRLRVAVWNSKSGAEIGSKNAISESITLSFNDVGDLQAYYPKSGQTQGFDFKTSVWNAPHISPKSKPKPTSSGGSNFEPPKNRHITIGAENGSVVVYNSQHQKQQVLGSFGFKVQSISASGDGSWVAAGSSDGAVSLFRSTDPTVQHLHNEANLKPGELSDDGRIGFRDGTKGGTDIWKIRDPKTGPRLIGSLEHSAENLASNPDGSRIAASMGYGALEAWHSDEGKNVIGGSLVTSGPYRYGSEGLDDLKMVGDGQHAVGIWNNGAKVVDLRTMGVSQRLTGKKTGIKQLGVSKDGKTLAAVDVFGMVTVWQWTKDNELQRTRQTKVTDENIQDVSVSDDGSKVAAVDGDSRISV